MKTKTVVLLIQLLLLLTVSVSAQTTPSVSAQKKVQTNQAVAPLIPMKCKSPRN